MEQKSPLFPWEFAQKAYDDGYHIEAIQILHGVLENKLQELLMLVGSWHFDTNLKDTWDIVNQIPFLSVLKSLFVIGQISKNEFQGLLKLNSMRNKIIHDSFVEHYEKPNFVFPKKEFDYVFQKSIEALKLIDQKGYGI